MKEKPKKPFCKHGHSRIPENLTKDGRGCRLCQQESYQRNRDKRAVEARRCHLARCYNITPEKYQSLLASQHGKCAICGATEGTSRYVNLVVDHNHETGEIRALLCARCNVFLGKAGDNIPFLEKCIAYLLLHDSTKTPGKSTSNVYRPPRRCQVDKDTACELYLAGNTTKEVAEVFGVSITTISNILKEKGVPKRNSHSHPGLSNREEKSCSVCHEVQKIDYFYKDNSSIDGRSCTCKTCHKKKYTPKRKAPPYEESGAPLSVTVVEPSAVESC